MILTACVASKNQVQNGRKIKCRWIGGMPQKVINQLKAQNVKSQYQLSLSRYGHLQIAEYLVEQGCEVDVDKVEIDCPNFLPKDLWPCLDVYAKKYKDPKVDEYLKSIVSH